MNVVQVSSVYVANFRVIGGFDLTSIYFNEWQVIFKIFLPNPMMNSWWIHDQNDNVSNTLVLMEFNMASNSSWLVNSSNSSQISVVNPFMLFSFAVCFPVTIKRRKNQSFQNSKKSWKRWRFPHISKCYKVKLKTSTPMLKCCSVVSKRHQGIKRQSWKA